MYIKISTRVYSKVSTGMYKCTSKKVQKCKSLHQSKYGNVQVYIKISTDGLMEISFYMKKIWIRKTSPVYVITTTGSMPLLKD